MARRLFLFFLLSTMTCFVVRGRSVVSPRKQAELMDFMIRYGYLTQPDPRIGTLLSGDDIKFAVTKLQHVAGLTETGSPRDPATVALVDQMRCAVPDFGPSDNARRKRRYATHGTVWHKKELTYKIVNYTPDLKKEEVEETIKKSLDTWSAVTQLKFQRITDPNKEADIMIKFVSGFHGDSRPADGPGKELAHAFFPLDNKGLAGDLHFDEDEHFDIHGADDKVDLNWLSLHELGHSLGLDHSYHPESVMFPFYFGFIKDLKLDRDDVEGIQQMYGKPHIDRVTPTPHTNPTPAPGIPDVCSLEKVDAMVMTKDQRTYAFSGAFFWEIGDQGAGKAMKIKNHWPGLHDDIDAAVTRRADGLTYFFKGNYYWIFKNKRRLRGPSDFRTHHFPSELRNMDAALEWPGNGKTYFFKGHQYWRYNWRNKRVDYRYPRNISKAWLNVPSELDAVLQWKNGKTYFMKGREYYALRRRGRPKVASGYPKRISAYWMGCSSEGLSNGKIAPGTSSAFAVLPSILALVSCLLFFKIVW